MPHHKNEGPGGNRGLSECVSAEDEAGGSTDSVDTTSADLEARRADFEARRMCVGLASVDSSVREFHGRRAAEAIGHFLREGRPGPPLFRLPADVATRNCGTCGRVWGEHSSAELGACGDVLEEAA